MRLIAIGVAYCCFLWVGLVGQEIRTAASRTPEDEGWKVLNEFMGYGLTYNSDGNVVPRNMAKPGKWRVKQARDVTGGKSGIVFGLRDTKVAVWPTPTLKIQCRDGRKVDIIVSTDNVVENLPRDGYGIPEGLSMDISGRQFAPDDQRDVRIAFDGEKPQLEHWNIGQKTGDMFAIGAKKHLEEILKATVLYFQFKPYGQDVTTLEFSVVGLGRYQTELKASCGVDMLR